MEMEFIDNHPVVSHRVRFEDRAEISDEEAAWVKDGNEVVWLVRARCRPPQYFPVEKDGEERYRFNVQRVLQAMPLTHDVREAALIHLNRGQPQLWQEEALPLGPSLATDQDHLTVLMLTEYLSDLGELREEEPLIDAVRRLVERGRTGTELPTPDDTDLTAEEFEEVFEKAAPVDPEREEELERLRQQLAEPEPEPDPDGPKVASFGSFDDEREDVEVVGSIYGPGHTGRTQALIEQAFGGMT